MDTWVAIIGHVDCGSDYKSICLTDHLRNDIARRAHPDADIKFANHLLTLIMMMESGKFLPAEFNNKRGFPAKIWDMPELGSNPNVPLEFIESHPKNNWDWPIMMRNPNITTQWLESLDKDHCRNEGLWQYVSEYPCITMDYVFSHPEIPWNWFGLSCNPSTTAEFIQPNPNLPWEFEALIENPNITWEIIQSRFDPNEHSDFGSQISGLPIITMDIVHQNPTFPWNYFSLAGNANIPLDVIKTHLNLLGAVDGLSFNSCVTIDDVLTMPKNRWLWAPLTTNPNITMKVILANPSLPWELSVLSRNPSITWSDIEANIGGIHGRPLPLSTMGGMRGLTWKKIIELDPIIKWKWVYIAVNRFGK